MARETRWLTFWVLTLFIVGCTTGDNGHGINSSSNYGQTAQTELNWLSVWVNRYMKEDMVRNMVRQYEFQHQDIKVNVRNIFQAFNSDNKDTLTKELVKYVKTGVIKWDIVPMDITNYNKIADAVNDPNWGQKYLVDFGEFDWYKNAHKNFVIKSPPFGSIFAGPFVEGVYYTLWYNKETFSKLGISKSDNEIKFSEFMDCIKIASEYNKTHDDKITILHMESNANLPYFFLSTLVLSEMGKTDSAKIDFNKGLNALKKGLDAFDQLAKFKPFEKLAQISGDESVIVSGKALFALAPTFTFNVWAAKNPEKLYNLVPCQLPYFEAPGEYYPGIFQPVFAVFKNAPNKDAAIKLLQYWCNEDVADQWVNKTKNPTGLKTRISDNDFEGNQFGKYLMGVEKQFGSNVFVVNLPEILFGARNKDIQIDATAILNGEKTGSQIYNSIVKQLKK